MIAESFGDGPEAFESAAEITDTGWAEKWKENFRARKVGRRLVVKPSWEEFRGDGGDVVLTVDPGQAFGTGTHETTRMCLRLVEDAFDDGSCPPPRTVLDVGTERGSWGSRRRSWVRSESSASTPTPWRWRWRGKTPR